MSCSMCSFRKQAESDIVPESVNDHFLGLVVLEYITDAVSLTHQRQKSCKCQESCGSRLSEYIGSCSEYCELLVSAKHNQCVHQCVAMVRTSDLCTFGRNVLLTGNFHFPVTVSKAPSDDRIDNRISDILVVNMFSGHVL